MAELQDDIKALEEEEKERKKRLAGIVLKGFVARVRDETKNLERILDETKKGDVKDALCDLVSRTIVEATTPQGGENETDWGENFPFQITVPRYCQKSMSDQYVYVYIGTHWIGLEQQQYFDFVKDAAVRCGLPDMYANSPSFMNKVFEAVAFRVSRHWELDESTTTVWINMKNGTLEIKSDGSVVLREHRKEDFFRYCLEYCYDPDAVCLGWLKYLDEVLPELDAQQLLAEAVAYCFTRNLKLEKMFVFLGGGSNGKSVALDVIDYLFGGASNVSRVSLSDLTTDNNARLLMENKFINISSESEVNLNPAILKQIVSGEPVNIRGLYHDTRQMSNYGKLFTSFNVLPRPEHTVGFFRRWIIFPFTRFIPEFKQDKSLSQKLSKEASGILNWVLAVLPGLLQRKAFSDSETCDKVLSDYKKRSNSALTFLEDRCVKDDDGRYKLKELYSKYCTFCCEEGIKNKFGKSTFTEILEGWGAERHVYNGCNCYNLHVKSDEE